MGRAFVLGMPFAVLLAFVASLCTFEFGDYAITALSAPGIILTFIFITQLFIYNVLFEEIPTAFRRLPLNTTNSFVENA